MIDADSRKFVVDIILIPVMAAMMIIYYDEQKYDIFFGYNDNYNDCI
jgi:hypothetical protein